MFHFLRLSLCLLFFGAASFSSIFPQQINSLYGKEQESYASIALDQEPVKVELLGEEASVMPGRPFWVAIRMEIADHWHAYWKNPGDAGMAPVVEWKLPEGWTVSSLLWPTPKRFALSTTVGFGYEKELVFLAEVTPSDISKEETAALSAELRWVVCSDETCLPGEATLALGLPVKMEIPQASKESTTVFNKARLQLPKKDMDVGVQRKENLIEVAFKDGKHTERTLQEAHFFPEGKEIDYKVGPMLSSDKDNPGNYKVVLKPMNAQEENHTNLKGVLVLHSEAGSEAYEIDMPIVGAEQSGLVSIADTSILKGDSLSFPSSIDNREMIHIQDDFDFGQGGVAMAILFAFLGGMILNLMPCVLPVISFKILSFVKLAGESRKLIFQHGLAFSGGVLVSFWALAGVLLGLQAYGQSVGWGFQLQEPLFVAALAAVLFIFALSLFGLFEIGTSLIALAGQAEHSSKKSGGMTGSFFSGVLATAVATPCTGPFLGSAVGFAVTLPAWQALLIFSSLGLGMSLPYLVLSGFPQLLRFMPKPGPWMDTFKQLMAFLMLASVLWLVWVFGAQTNSLALTLLLVGFFFLSFAGWIYGRWATPLKIRKVRLIATLAALLIFACGSYAIWTSTSSWVEALGGGMPSMATVASAEAGEDVWEDFSPERVAELRAQGVPVFIDFTAKWCLICQANHLVMTTDEVAQQFSQKGVVKMKADWTKSDPVITAELRKFGRNSVPLYVLYDKSPDTAPQILPQVLTPESLIEALAQIK